MEGYTLIVHKPSVLNRSKSEDKNRLSYQALHHTLANKSNPRSCKKSSKLLRKRHAQLPDKIFLCGDAALRRDCSKLYRSSYGKKLTREWREKHGLSSFMRVRGLNAHGAPVSPIPVRTRGRVLEGRPSAILRSAAVTHPGTGGAATSDSTPSVTSSASAWSPPSAPDKRWSRPKARKSAGRRCQAVPLTCRKRN
jgi:hypothetical protein